MTVTQSTASLPEMLQRSDERATAYDRGGDD
jgi:hypothetical protein